MWIYILLGFVQGIFEWIPISSEGIVALMSQLLIKEINPVDVALFLHLGTFFVILVYFRREWKEVVTLKNPKLFHFLIISTFVSLVIGYPLYHIVKDAVLGNGLLVVMGLGLLLTSYFHKSKTTLGLSLNRLAAISGCLQGLAVIPGLSRSGSTIFGLSLGKLSPSEVLKISYMMSAPIILASTTYILLENPVLIEGWPSLVSSFFMGYITLHFLMKVVKKIELFWLTLSFGILCFLGAMIGFVI
jgi:undecaprenyl-diphosphatase